MTDASNPTDRSALRAQPRGPSTAELTSVCPVSCRHLTVTFAETIALDNVTFELEPGDFVAVIGPNGSGKTTLLRSILGLLRPTSGTVTVLGASGSEIARIRPSIGYVPQRRPFDPKFPATVFEVALMGTYCPARLLRGPSATDRSRTLEALATVGLADRASHTAGHLSGGQQQRLLIARALVQNPRLLLLDEPTAGVDVASQESLIELIRDLHQRRLLTTLLVTHDINEVLPCVDKVLYLNRRVHAFGPCPEVLNRKTLEELYRSPVMILEHAGRPYVIVSDRHA